MEPIHWFRLLRVPQRAVNWRGKLTILVVTDETNLRYCARRPVGVAIRFEALAARRKHYCTIEIAVDADVFFPGL